MNLKVIRTTIVILVVGATAASAAPASPLLLYYAWVDQSREFAMMASLNGENEIKVAVTQPKADARSEYGLWSEIPDLKSALPDQKTLNEFRAALQAKAAAGSAPYDLHYVASAELSDPPEKLSAFQERLRRAFSQRERPYLLRLSSITGRVVPVVLLAGDTLVGNKESADSLLQLEASAVALLFDMANNPKAMLAMTLQPDGSSCANVRVPLDEFLITPMESQRQKLQDALRPAPQLVRADDDAREYSNGGVAPATLSVEVSSSGDFPSKDVILSYAVDGGSAIEISGRTTSIVVPPCSNLRLSISARHWYDTPKTSLEADEENSTVRVRIPDARLSAFAFFGGVALLIGLPVGGGVAFKKTAGFMKRRKNLPAPPGGPPPQLEKTGLAS